MKRPYCLVCDRRLTNIAHNCVPELLRKQRRYLRDYKSGAVARNLEFTLTFEEFIEYWHEICVYCGNQIETIGLDRVDNTKGYILGNVLPCCTLCNLMKRTMTADNFIAHCRVISERFPSI